jgi:hypothetical protein
MGLAEKVIQWVLSYGFILWVYPMGLAEKTFVVLHHHVPVTLTPAIPLIRTFNPDF